MKSGFLKCFYGYHNWGDELLFWGVIDYIAIHYPTITELDVEVADVAWMQQRRDRHCQWMADQEIAEPFVSGVRQLSFVPLSKDISDNFRYDMYFLGGGELFAESRGFHGGRNYLLRYVYALTTKKYVLLGGFEAASSWWQKLLYQMLLPAAEAIVCRDQTSCQTVSIYVSDNTKVVLYEDFAVKVINAYKERTNIKEQKDSYALVNLIEHRLDDAAREAVQQWYQNYQGKIIYFPCTAKDRQWHETLSSRAIPSEIYDWTEHSIAETLGLFAQADAVVGSRLHFLLPAQLLDRPRLAISYAEKIDKLITSTF